MILGFENLSVSDKASLRRNRKAGKWNRYFQDVFLFFPFKLVSDLRYVFNSA